MRRVCGFFEGILRLIIRLACTRMPARTCALRRAPFDIWLKSAFRWVHHTFGTGGTVWHQAWQC